jgi:hypothetical protein
MYVKRVARAAAIAASVGVTALAAGTGLAGAVPLAPPSCDQQSQSNCQPAPGGGSGQQGGGAGQAGGQQGPQGANAPRDQQSNAPQTTQSQTQPTHDQAPQPAQSNAPQTTQDNAPQTTHDQAPQTTQGNGPQNLQGGNSHDQQGNGSQNPQGGNSHDQQGNGSQNPQGGNSHDQQGNGPQNPQGGDSSQSPQTSAPDQQKDRPRPPPFTPAGAVDRGNDQLGGPRDAPRGFSAPGNGAPPPPPEKGPGWNDGPPPGAPPQDWDGPPPAGGWDGPPPPGGWNQRWDGPQRDVNQGRTDFGRFNYDNYTAVPVFNPTFGGFGFWYFGLWIPLF